MDQRAPRLEILRDLEALFSVKTEAMHFPAPAAFPALFLLLSAEIAETMRGAADNVDVCEIPRHPHASTEGSFQSAHQSGLHLRSLRSIFLRVPKEWQTAFA